MSLKFCHNDGKINGDLCSELLFYVSAQAASRPCVTIDEEGLTNDIVPQQMLEKLGKNVLHFCRLILCDCISIIAIMTLFGCFFVVLNEQILI